MARPAGSRETKYSRNLRTKRRNALVADLVGYLRKYVVLTQDQYLVVAVWIVHTYVALDSMQTPYLAITSPDKRCGKTRLLEVIEHVVFNPWRTIVPSEAVLFRKIAAQHPTLLLDETDAIFNPKNEHRYEGHRALLDAGNRKGAVVSRCVGSSNESVDFDPYSPKAVAGIGTLPATVTDRAIPIRLKRRRPDEKVERFLLRNVKPEAEALRTRIHAWLRQNGRVEDEPEMPPEIDDRMQEGCEVLVALADAFRCGRSLRKALVNLLSQERLDDTELWRHRLLRDLRIIWNQDEVDRGKQVRGIATEKILHSLWEMEESPWTSYYGRHLGDKDLAALLKPYGVGSRVLSGGHKRGYRKDDLYDVWRRYLDDLALENGDG